jgi:hypothetical protein
MTSRPDEQWVGWAIERTIDEWGGAIHRDHLAELYNVTPSDRGLFDTLMILYRAERIDFGGPYIVRTPERESETAWECGCGALTDGAMCLNCQTVSRLEAAGITAGDPGLDAIGQWNDQAQAREKAGLAAGRPALVPCAVCGTPMDSVLPRAGYTTHPNCDGDEQPDGDSDG